MKKALLFFGLLWSAIANAQFTPGQLLTAAELNSQFALYAPLSGAVFSGPLTANGMVSGTGFTTLLGPYLTSATAAATYAPLSNPIFTGIITGNNSATSGNSLVVNATSNTASGAQILLKGNGVTTPNKFLRAFNGNFQITNSLNSQVLLSIDDSGNVTSAGAYQSPFLNGIPTATTAAVGTNTIQVATTAYVFSEFASPPLIGNTAPNAASFTTVNASGLITPSTTNGIKGTAAADNANAGSVGEYLSNSATGISLSTSVTTNITSMTLSAGDWDVSGVITFIPAGSTTATLYQASTSTTSGTNGPLGAASLIQASFAAGLNQSVIAPAQRINVSSSTTVYLLGTASFSVSTMTANGFIRARRIR